MKTVSLAFDIPDQETFRAKRIDPDPTVFPQWPAQQVRIPSVISLPLRLRLIMSKFTAAAFALVSASAELLVHLIL